MIHTISEILNKKYPLGKKHLISNDTTFIKSFLKNLFLCSNKSLTIFIDKKNNVKIGIGVNDNSNFSNHKFFFFYSKFNDSNIKKYTPDYLITINKAMFITSYTNVPLSNILLNTNYIKEDINVELDEDSIIQTPNYLEFKKIIKQAKCNITSENLKKVVIAKKTNFKFKKNTSVRYIGYQLLHNELKSNKKNYFYEFVNLEKHLQNITPLNSVFVSYTPEKLLKTNGNKLYTEALAGSTFQNNFDLLSDKKNHEENLIVCKKICNDLQDYCTNINSKKSKIKQLSYIKHIVTPIVAKIENTKNIQNIINKLHPTPATLGYPSNNAYTFINTYNNFDRSLFEGVGGFIDNSNHLSLGVVLLRSALITDDNLELFAGAGILQESNCDEEWQEISHKMTIVLKKITSKYLKIVEIIKNNHE